MASAIDTARADAPLRAGGAGEREGEAPPPLAAPRAEAPREDVTGAGAPPARDEVAAPGEAVPRRRRLLRPLTSLTQRIVAINLAGLAVLVAGVLYLNQLRTELIELRVASLVTQGQIIATAIAEMAAVSPEATRYDAFAANEVLRQLTLPTGQRAQIYTSGRLMGDTRSFDLAQARVEGRPLAAPGEGSGLLTAIEGFYSRVERLFNAGSLPRYIETPVAGITDDAEVYAAARGTPTYALRANAEGQLIVSVAVPIQRLKTVMGVLVLSTEGGDIDRVIRAGRVEILRVFILAAVVSLLLSFLLARGIARPLRRLASAAGRAALHEDEGGGPRVEIPDYSRRADEIGELSGAFRHMTDALYSRIDAIESFAADVAHEIKNPLTSLRSAVETMDLARTDEARARLLSVIKDDVARMDRLVTDISNASRLDAELVRERRAPFDVAALCESMADIAGAGAEEHGVAIEVAVPPTPLVVRGLESRIGQVLANLIENGVSFSPPGGRIRVAARRAADGAAEVTVEDEGPGIPGDARERIFERFYTERPEGEAFGRHSGLGLSISKQIVEAHGGTIRAENRGSDEAPEGARFVLRLPA